MSVTVTIGKRLIPVEHIALVEPFDPSAPSQMRTERSFQSRIVMVDRESVLSEERPAFFVQGYGFRLLEQDAVVVNPLIRFGVETFAPAEGFNPTKPYKTRITWRDGDNTQSRLLLSEPERVLAIAVRGETGIAEPGGQAPASEEQLSSSGGKRKSRRKAAEPAPF